MAEAVRGTLRGWLILLGLCGFSWSTFAHQLDEYLQATLVSIEPGEIRLEVNLTPGVAIADKVIGLIDRNQDGVVSTNEAAAYAESLRHDLAVRLDGKNAGLRVMTVTFPDLAELRTGWGIIQIEYSVAAGVLASGAHTLTLENRHQPSMSVYLLNAIQPVSSSIQIVEQKRNGRQTAGEIAFEFRPPTRGFGVRGAVISFGALLCIALFTGVWQVKRRGEIRVCGDGGKT